MKYLGEIFKYLFTVVTLFSLGCNYGDTVAAGGNTNVTPLPPVQTVVCDPFNTQNPALEGHGLEAQLYYLSDSQPRYTNVMDYINNGIEAPAAFYLNDVNVPTRPFDRGFFTQAGQLLVNADGLPLYEYFAFDMQSILTLGPTDVEGNYQFAVLSDDGSILEINDTGNGYRTLINNDGTHPTEMGCETDSIPMTAETQIPIKFHYYQGPRYHIALMLLWRPYPTDPTQVVDPLCGQEGNSLFFDPTQNPSTPQQAFLDLQSRGWSVLTPSNYLLPFASGASNPCAEAAAPVISNFRVDGITQTSAVVSWTTDIPSSSQVAYELSTDTAYTFTTTDPTLTTDHSVTLNGLADFGFYSVYGLSSASNVQSITNILNFRTLR